MRKCNILGIDINVTNMDETLSYICRNLKELKGKYICVSNVHTTVMSYENNQYKNFQENAILRLPDGKPLSILASLKGFKNAKRVTGPDLMDKIFEKSPECKYTHYFYGSTEKTLEDMIKNIKKSYPDIVIVGKKSPPYRELLEHEKKEILEEINCKKPDFLWIGLGAPKQEKWMFENKGKIDSIMIGVGAAFDYKAGNIKRGPNWMQNLSLEWLYRLMQDPKRLFKRYLETNTKFLYYLAFGKKGV